MHVDEGQMEGSESQNFYLCLDFHFMKSRKKSFKKGQKVTCFLA